MRSTYEPKAKRRKVDGQEVSASPRIGIKTAPNLHSLLHFKQVSSPEVKQDIQTFKEFLSGINQADELTKTQQLAILNEYCDSQDYGDETPCCRDLISTWSFAAEHQNETILSAVPSVLALLLKTISSQLKFRDFGISLCRTLLRKEQLRLFSRAFASATNKEHLISPCIRLLTEVVSYDGGALASNLYSRREVVFKNLDEFLIQRSVGRQRNDLEKKRPTLRRIAQRYVLANLKFQSAEDKSDLIREGKILRNFLRDIKGDGADMVSEVLASIEKHIVDDQAISRPVKTSFFNPMRLEPIGSIYGVPDQTDDSGVTHSVRSRVHELLLKICTQRRNGVLLADTGWYPLGSDPSASDSLNGDEETIDLGLDSPSYFDSYEKQVPTKNGILSTFISSLKPATDSFQAELLLKIFDSAPELVADYFTKHTHFSTPPQDTPAWFGESAFLFSVIRLPVRHYCGWHGKFAKIPPPSSIVVESIIPRPLESATLTKCLNSAQQVIVLFGARALTAAFEKLNALLEMYKVAALELPLWSQGRERLIRAFKRRSPTFKDVVHALQRASKDDLQLRGALIELLHKYSQILPELAFKEKFDVAPLVKNVMASLQKDDIQAEKREMLLKQLSNLVEIGHQSPSTRWWQKSEQDSVSVFGSLLQIITQFSSQSLQDQRFRRVLRDILVENGIIPEKSRVFDTLFGNVSANKKWSPSSSTLSFIDDCMARIARQPVHYLDIAESNRPNNASASQTHLLPVCIVEQWPYLVKASDQDALQNATKWFARFLYAIESLEEEEKPIIASIRESILAAANKKSATILEAVFNKQRKHPINVDSLQVVADNQTTSISDAVMIKEATPPVDLDTTFGPPSTSPSSLSGLDRWPASLDFELEISSGRLSRLIQALASASSETRLLAFSTLRILLPRLQSSAPTFPDAPIVHILTGSLLETIQPYLFPSTPTTTSPQPPTILPILTTSLLPILLAPSSALYPLSTTFLHRAPVWPVSTILPYFLESILLSDLPDPAPSTDPHTTTATAAEHVSHSAAIQWVLDLLAAALRHPEDLNLYQQSHVFERLLALYASDTPIVTARIRKDILRVVFRATQIRRVRDNDGDPSQDDGGVAENVDSPAAATAAACMTLITRAGLLSWLAARLTLAAPDSEEGRILSALTVRVQGMGETGEVDGWKRRVKKMGEKAKEKGEKAEEKVDVNENGGAVEEVERAEAMDVD